jgi:hypothetical protein
MIDKVNTSQLQDILANAAAKQANTARSGKSTSADASLQADYSELIKQASNASPDEQARLQQAKELFESGQLETLENIRQAAENMAKYGV